MHNYELMFACRTRDGATVPYLRVIAATDQAMAVRIGYAMRGELARPGFWLDHFIYAIPAEWSTGETGRPAELTMNDPFIGTLAAWRRVLFMLGLAEGSVKWVYSWRIGLPDNPRGHNVAQCNLPQQPAEIIGFFPWPATEVAP